MILELDTEVVRAAGLNPTIYGFLYSLYKKEPYPWQIPQQILVDLQEKEWIKIISEGEIHLRQKFIDFIGAKEETNSVESWIGEWRALWPEGVESMGRPLRGDKQGCLKKMKTFVKENKQFTKEDIMEVTKMYLFKKARKGYEATTCADYFISKNGLSVLSALLEDVAARENYRKNLEGGGSSFHKQV